MLLKFLLLSQTPSRVRASLLWSPVLDFAYLLAKQLLASVPVLTHPEPGAPVSLALDASDSHVGAVLQQKVHGFWSPLDFF